MLPWGLGAWATVGLTDPPEESWLKPQKTQREKPPVKFSHRRHPKPNITCKECHHDYQEGRNLWQEGQSVEKCQACHELTPKADVLEAKEAFHRQGKGCQCGSRRDPSDAKVATVARNKGEDEGRLGRRRRGYFSDRLC
jgi:hypothetical protein